MKHHRRLRYLALVLSGVCLTQLGTCLFQLFGPIASLGESFGLTYLFGQIVP